MDVSSTGVDFLLQEINCSSFAASAPWMQTILLFEPDPETISIAFCGSLKVLASNRINSRLAAPSTGGAAMRIRRAPAYSPATSLRDAREIILTAKVRPRSLSEY